MSPIISTLSNSWSSGSKPIQNILGSFQGSSTSSIDVGGVLLYHGSHSETAEANNQYSFTVDAAGTFYVAMIGGSGAVSWTAARNGFGGIGILEVTVPASAVGTRFYCNQGGGGPYQSAETTLTNILAAAPGGGKAGKWCGVYSQYSKQPGGGALSSISKWSNSSNVANSFAVVGGGGGGGNTGSDGSSGGGFDMSGSVRENSKCGFPGTTTAGGAKAESTQSYGNCAGDHSNGTSFEGGQGSSGSYESGAGGGGGYYGGGGGVSGGGYNSGNGGGGSGKLISAQLPTGCTMSIAQLSGTNLTDTGQVNSRDPWGQLQTWISTLIGSTVTIPAVTTGREYGQTNSTSVSIQGSAGNIIVWTKQQYLL